MADAGRKNYSIFGEELDAESQASVVETETESISQQPSSNRSNQSSDLDSARPQFTEEAQIDTTGAEDSDRAVDEELDSGSAVDSDARSASGDVQAATKRSRDRHVKSARDTMSSLAAEESSNLTRQLLTDHIQYRQIRFPPKDAASRLSRAKELYASWPLDPQTVPRQSSQVWPGSIIAKPSWTPSRDLEDAIFASMLKKARRQWNEKSTELKAEETNESQTESTEYSTESEQPITKADLNSQSSRFSTLESAEQPEADEPTFESERSHLKRKESKADEPIFSADEERSLKILKPSIRSVISTTDKLLFALHQSNNKPVSQTKAIQDESSDPAQTKTTDVKLRTTFTGYQRYKRKKPRDWSNILGVASMIGVPSDVLSRAASRCAAIFGEGMSFATLNEEDAGIAPKTVTIDPADFQSRGSTDMLNPRKPPFMWTAEQGCPFPDCAWFGIRPGEGRTERSIKDHVRLKHEWVKSHGLEQLQQLLQEKDGAIHIDGYLKPIQKSQIWGRTFEVQQTVLQDDVKKQLTSMDED
jgi:hypothetical protein